MDQTFDLSALGGPEFQAFATGFPIVLAHVGVTLLMLMLGATLYALLTPWKEISLIRNGNSAAAVAFGGVLAGLAIPLVRPCRRPVRRWRSSSGARRRW